MKQRVNYLNAIGRFITITLTSAFAFSLLNGNYSNVLMFGLWSFCGCLIDTADKVK